MEFTGGVKHTQYKRLKASTVLHLFLAGIIWQFCCFTIHFTQLGVNTRLTYKNVFTVNSILFDLALACLYWINGLLMYISREELYKEDPDDSFLCFPFEPKTACCFVAWTIVVICVCDVSSDTVFYFMRPTGSYSWGEFVSNFNLLFFSLTNAFLVKAYDKVLLQNEILM